MGNFILEDGVIQAQQMKRLVEEICENIGCNQFGFLTKLWLFMLI